MSVLTNRQALEAVAAAFRSNRLPPKSLSDKIVRVLDAMALAIALGGEEPSPSAFLQSDLEAVMKLLAQRDKQKTRLDTHSFQSGRRFWKKS